MHGQPPMLPQTLVSSAFFCASSACFRALSNEADMQNTVSCIKIKIKENCVFFCRHPGEGVGPFHPQKVMESPSPGTPPRWKFNGMNYPKTSSNQRPDLKTDPLKLPSDCQGYCPPLGLAWKETFFVKHYN